MNHFDAPPPGHSRMPAMPDKAAFPSSPEIVNNALLLASLPSLAVPHFLAPVIARAVGCTRNRLVIILFSRFFNVCPLSAETDDRNHRKPTFVEKQGLPHTLCWDAVQRILTFTYVQATKVAFKMDKVLMDIDVLLKGFNEDLEESIGNEMNIVFRVNGDAIATPLPRSISTVRDMYLMSGESVVEESCTLDPSQSTLPSTYPVTALGGTFDHLHAGHKILLSMAAYITNQKLIVGITDDALLQNKSNKEFLENLSTRTRCVHDFLAFCKPGIIPDIVPITDVYGPTGWDPNIQALVVSKETSAGAEAIAKHRATHNLPPLQCLLIDVISATETSLQHEDVELLKLHKLSSTYIRQWIADKHRQKEEGEISPTISN